MRGIASLVDTYIVLMNISYVSRVAFPLDRVLAQYFDLEHIETVHPTTLGQYRLLEVVGNSIIFEQRRISSTEIKHIVKCSLQTQVYILCIIIRV